MTAIREIETATAEEQQLIDRAASAVAESNWTIGDCANQWCEQFARGRTDNDFAELIGASRQTVNYARRIHERFCHRRGNFRFSWTQWRALLAEDEESLDQSIDVLLSDDVDPSFQNLMMLHRARTGQPEPTAAANLSGADVPDPEPTLWAPAESEDQPEDEPPQPEDPPANGEPIVSTNTLSGDSITDPPVVNINSVGVDMQLLERGLKELPDQDLTDRQRADLARLLRQTANVLDPKPKATPKRFKPPTVDDVRAYCQERRNTVDPQSFVDFYASKGWQVGKNKMKDWQACVRTWEQRDKQTAAASEPARVRGTDWSEYDG